MSDVPRDGIDLVDSNAEIDRLRSLVGPNESDYAALRSEIAAASRAVRAAEAANGELRGQVTRLEFELERARQDQVYVRRLIVHPAVVVRNRIRSIRRR